MIILFAGTEYYPSGGALDVLSVHETFDDAVANTPPPEWGREWVNYLDTETMGMLSFYCSENSSGTWILDQQQGTIHINPIDELLKAGKIVGRGRTP